MTLLARIDRLERSAPTSGACRCPFDHDEAMAFLVGESPGDACRRCSRPLAMPMVLAPYAPEGVRL